MRRRNCTAFSRGWHSPRNWRKAIRRLHIFPPIRCREAPWTVSRQRSSLARRSDLPRRYPRRRETLYAECRLNAGAELTLPRDYEETALYVVSGDVDIDTCHFGSGTMVVC